MSFTTPSVNPPLGNQTEPDGQIGSQVTISYIVRSVQNELNDYSMQQYKRLLQLVIDGLRELRIFHQSAIQVDYARLNAAGIWKYPNDYLYYTKIGIPIHGQLVTLSVNNQMLLNRANECGEDIRVMSANNGFALSGLAGGYMFAPHFNNGNYVGGLYGAGGGFNTAYFRDDKVAKQIQFDGIIPTILDGNGNSHKEIVVEYASSGISMGTVISAECINPLKKYVHVYRVKYDPRVPMSTKQMLENDLHVATRDLRMFTQKFTVSEFLDSLWRNKKQSPKS